MLKNYIKSRKGQGAMEYLMTYSWAILIVLVVGLFLWQIGIFKTQSTAPVITGLYQLRPLSETIVYNSQSQDFSVALINTQGAPILVQDVEMNETVGGTVCNNIRVNDIAFTNNVTVSKGDAFKISATCGSKNKGEQVNMYIVINYGVVLEETTNHQEEGYIQVTVE